jgi:hypothetical protein
MKYFMSDDAGSLEFEDMSLNGPGAAFNKFAKLLVIGLKGRKFLCIYFLVAVGLQQGYTINAYDLFSGHHGSGS